jgi:hypothetical protein
VRKRLALYGILALAAWLALWSVGRASAEEAAQHERAAIHERNAVVALRGYRASRKLVEAETRKREAAERRLAVIRAQTDETIRAVTLQADAARAVLADTGATIVDLRRELANSLNLNARLVNEVSRERAAADSTLAAFHAERMSLLTSLAAADSTIAAQGRAIAAWKQAAECRVLWMKCPTRTQAFVGGFLLGGGIAWGAK